MERSEWARTLRGRPGVHTASSLAEALSVVDGIIAEQEAVDAALHGLVST